MNRFLKGMVFVLILLVPLVFYFLRAKESKPRHEGTTLAVAHKRAAGMLHANGVERVAPDAAAKPRVAVIFDDLGESLNDIRQLYSLGIPLTVAIIPSLKNSVNIAHYAKRCGFDVIVHLPLEPGSVSVYKGASYKFITRKMRDQDITSLTNYYLNAVPMAIGANNHMGSAATRDRRVMGLVLDAVRAKKYLFIDSRTALDSIAYPMAVKKGMVSDFNHGFIDAVSGVGAIENKLDELEQRAIDAKAMVIIGHPRKNTLAAFKNKLSRLKGKVEFVTLSDYFSRN